MEKLSSDNIPFPLMSSNPAPGGPGDPPYWTRADKRGLGTALSWSSQVWFTIAGGVITEIYYPDVDTPQTRDLQFLVTDGSTFFHDPKVDFDHHCEPIDPQALGFKMTNQCNKANYTLTHEVICEPGSPCVLIRTRITGDPNLLPHLRVFVLLAPHMEGAGWGNSGFVARTRNGTALCAHAGNTWLAMAVKGGGLGMTGCGYVGVNDGWQDIIGQKRLPVWKYDSVFNGNIALTGEINLAGQTEFILALAFSNGDDQTPNGALVTLGEALSNPFEAPAEAPAGTYGHLNAFLKGWKDVPVIFKPGANATFDGGRLFEMSRNVLLAHEDKTYNGALVASLSTPWGETLGDSNVGYHMVWPRDMCQSATALLATGEMDLPFRGLMFLFGTQKPDGSWFQNFYITGKGHWFGVQLDEYSFPMILAYRLHLANALGTFDVLPLVKAAAGALILAGPATPQERWEENSGYSPSTLAANIAGLVCAAALNDPSLQSDTAKFLLDYADFLESNIEKWMVTTQGTLLPGVARHYIRILPYPGPTAADLDPNTATVFLKNQHTPDSTAAYAAKTIVDGGFLELVRYGIRKAGDQLFEDSLKVLDATIKHDFPSGPCWYRYNHDGYGQMDDGSAFIGYGKGRPWPLLTGERAHYELAAGRDISGYVKALEAFAGQDNLFPEQIWDAPDLATPILTLRYGGPTGSSTPLAWAHAEYIKLVRSLTDGKVYDRLDIVANRYPSKTPSPLEIWNYNRQVPVIQRGKTLRIHVPAPFRLHWSNDGWNTNHDTNCTTTEVFVYYADIPTDAGTAGPLKFTFFWTESGSWEPGGGFTVNLI
jgi:glucoamylase